MKDKQRLASFYADKNIRAMALALHKSWGRHAAFDELTHIGQLRYYEAAKAALDALNEQSH